MKTYFIESEHIVNIDDYNEGEGKQVNWYNQKAMIKAETPRQAIEKYFEKELYFKFSFENACITHEEDEDEPTNRLEYSVLVDEENSEANEKEREQWKKGKKVLYSNSIILSIFEVQPIKI